MKSTQIAIGVIAALAIAGGGFAAGMTYERAQTPNTPTAATQTTTGRAAGGRQVIGGAGGSGAFAGQIPIIGRGLAVNDGSITVAAVERGQGQQGTGASPTTTSPIVLVGASTPIVQTTENDVELAD